MLQQTNLNGMENSLVKKLQNAFAQSNEFRVRTVEKGKTVYVVSLDTMCSDTKINDFVITPLICLADGEDVDCLDKKIACSAQVEKIATYDLAVSKLVNGYTLAVTDDLCFAVDTRIETGRSIVEPPTSLVLHGPREGFVEDAKTNLTLIRKRLKTPLLKAVNLSVGKFTSTAVFVLYVENIASKEIVEKVIQKIKAINVDGVMDSSLVANYLDDRKTALFKRIGSTEKPDVAVGKLLEGRIAVVVDGSPMVLTLPYLFIEDLQSPNDYYEVNEATTFSRILRLVSVLVSILLPALYVCLQKYNYQIIPMKFLITVLNATKDIPFSPMTEMLLVVVIFDVLREANLRMPSAVGISLSLVGAIVLGDAAVQAGLLGAPAVMIGALSGIGLYTMPENTVALSMLRLAFTFVGGVSGLYGVLVAFLTLATYLVSLNRFNTPFLAPFAPSVASDKQDAVWQRPLFKQTRRPVSFENVNAKRRGK